MTYRRTSFGSPYSEKTRAFACVYPYGPDSHLAWLGRRPASTRAHDLDSVGRKLELDMIDRATIVTGAFVFVYSSGTLMERGIRRLIRPLVRIEFNWLLPAALSSTKFALESPR